jgi:hypothetical protein
MESCSARKISSLFDKIVHCVEILRPTCSFYLAGHGTPIFYVFIEVSHITNVKDEQLRSS